MRIFTGRRLQLWSLIFSPDGEYLLALGEQPSPFRIFVPVWEVNGDVKPLRTLEDRGPDDDNTIGAAAFSPDGRSVLIEFYGWHTHNLAYSEATEVASLTTLKPQKVSSDGRLAVSVNGDSTKGKLRINTYRWDGARWTKGWAREFRFDRELGRRGRHPTGYRRYEGSFLSPDGKRLVVQMQTEAFDTRLPGAEFHIYDTATGSVIGEWRGDLYLHPNRGIVGPNGQLVFVAERSLHVIDPTTPDSIPHTRTNSSRKHFTAAAFSPDGKWLATTSNDTTVTMWDTTTWQPVQRFAWKIGRLRAVAFAPDGLTCAAGSDTGKVVLFDVDG